MLFIMYILCGYVCDFNRGTWETHFDRMVIAMYNNCKDNSTSYFRPVVFVFVSCHTHVDRFLKETVLSELGNKVGRCYFCVFRASPH